MWYNKSKKSVQNSTTVVIIFWDRNSGHRCFSSIDFFVDVGIFFLGTLDSLDVLGLFTETGSGVSSVTES